MEFEYNVWLEIVHQNLYCPTEGSIEMEKIIRETIIENKKDVLLTIDGVVSFKLCFNIQTQEYYQIETSLKTEK